MTIHDDPAIQPAAAAIQEADALLITAGAGMGVDAGLPDFRGAQGFWRAYPPYQKLGLDFADVANPRWFRTDPSLAWGFYGHRFQLYRTTRPHAGFALLKKWADRLPRGAFVFTSNVDGHFQRAGFDEPRVVECHGSINWMQCTDGRGCDPWPVDPAVHALIELDEASMRAREPFPSCPTCGSLARPNILMFGNWQWYSTRTRAQEQRLERWLQDANSQCLTIIECGAGTAIPTVRCFSEHTAAAVGATLIRVNIREPHAPPGSIELALGAREALEAIDRCLSAK